MYTAFYGLREKPFALVPDPRYLFLAESHREALAHLLYGIDQAEGFIAVTGEVGTGKTTICRTLLERLGSDTEVAFLFNPSRSGIELLQDICAEFGLLAAGLSRSDLTAEINRFLLDKRRENRKVLLIIDEAQNLSDSTLEQVRLLSNLETSSQKLIQILLLGQPELDVMLDSPDLRQLRQRISVRWRLHAPGARETRAYVKHRVHVAAGAERDLFTDGALREIHRRTGGVPRLINVLCDRVLLAGYVARAPRIGPSIVKQAAREIPDARRRPLLGRPSAATRRATKSVARRVGAGAVFAAGLVLGLAVAGGVLLGSTDVVRDRLQPALASWMGGAEPQDVIAPVDPPVSSSPPFDGTATVAAPNPELFETQELRPVEPEKIDEMSAVVGQGLAEGEFLAAILQEEDPDLTRRDAMNAVLDAYALEEFDVVPLTDEAAVAALAERGLDAMPVRAVDLDALRSLNHPALLRVRPLDEDDSRLVALLRVDGDLASVYGLTGLNPLWVPIDELLQQWDGEGWVIWNDFEAIRPILAFGEQGTSVSWLQEALLDLGYFDGAPSGLFDVRTVEGVQAFQRQHGLEADGMAGPRTRMVLYQLLDRYEVPRLDAGDVEDAG